MRTLDPITVESLYRAHYNYIRAVCMRIMRDPDDANEMVNTVFVRLLQPHSQFENRSEPRTWLYRVAVNECLMRKRRETCGKRKAEILLQITDVTMTAHQPDAIAKILVERALADMPPGYREALVMHDALGYEHEEIARIKGYTAGTSKSQLHKGRIRMREILEGKAPVNPH